MLFLANGGGADIVSQELMMTRLPSARLVDELLQLF
jgi:hypothetical protein